MKTKRKKYTQELKEEAVKLISEQGYRVTVAARNMGISENKLGRGNGGAGDFNETIIFI